MKKVVITLKILAVVFSISAFVFIFAFNDETEKQIALKIKVKQPQPEQAPELVIRKSTFYTKPELVPPDLIDFYSMKSGERLNLVTKLMNNKNVDSDIIEFLKAEIFNRTHMDTTRNNMANALCWQHQAAPELHSLFIKMLDDENEDPVWRDYCIQFLSECYDKSNDKPLIIETMHRYSLGNDSKAGTALVHLAYQEKLNNVPLSRNFGEQLANKLEAPETHSNTKTSILAIMGKRGDRSQLPLIRIYAKQDDNAALKATAIGSLGLMGDESDLNLIAKALEHKNGRVKLAANAAFNKIQKREQNKGFNPPNIDKGLGLPYEGSDDDIINWKE